MSGKKEHAIKSPTRLPKRRKNSEDISVNASLGKTTQCSKTTSIGVRKGDRSQSLEYEEAGNSRKSSIKEQNSLLRTNSELRTSLRSKTIEENPRLTVAKKKPVRSASERILRTTERYRLAEKEELSKRSTKQPSPIKEASELESADRENTVSENCKVLEKDPSKLTLAERIKLFNEKIATEKAVHSRDMLYNGNKIARKNLLASRSRTQPVTSEEFEAAYKKPSAPHNNRHSMFDRTGETICESNNLSIKIPEGKQQEEECVCESSKQVPLVLRKESKASIATKRSDSATSSRLKSNLLRKPAESRTGILQCDTRRRNSSSSRMRSLSKEGKNKAKEGVNTIRQCSPKTANQVEKSLKKNERLNNKQLTRKCLKKKSQTITNEVSQISEEKTKSKMERKYISTSRKVDEHSRLSDKSYSDRTAHNPTSSTRNRVDYQALKTDLDSKILMTDTSLTMTRLVREVNSMEIRSISIANRLAALEQNGRSKWKHQVPCESDLNPLASTVSIGNDSTDGNILQKSDSATKQGKLAERLEKLETASEKWRRRVATPDAVQYSIYGKMKVDYSESFNSAVSPLLIQVVGDEANRGKKIPRAERFRVERGGIGTPAKKIINESVTAVKKTVPSRRIVEADKTGLIHPRSDITVAVPKSDDLAFATFFSGVSAKRCHEEYIDLNETDFDVIKSRSELLVQRRRVPTQGRRLKSKNPLRVLAARTDLRTEYTEVKSGVAERIMKDLNIEKLAKSSSLAVEALAGLASTEDFNAITLRDAARPAEISGSTLSAYKNLMLILIKGRRHVQVRLVEPIASSINSGDNYILVTPTEVYNYVGKYSNVIERTRSAEIASNIQQNKDLGCTANQVITVSEEKPTCSKTSKSKFWQLLGIEDEDIDVTEAGHPDEDEVYESVLINTNMVYELIDKELVPYTDYWGVIPKIGMLDPSKILVFDFGSEMYIWNGKLAELPNRKLASDMAKELWKNGYDYSECTVCPVTSASVIGARKDSTSIESRASVRPDWCLLLKVTQHMEPILFKEKFLDWPDFKQVIRTKESDPKEQTDGTVTVLPFDVNLIIPPNVTPVDLILEGSHLGRGTEWFDEELRKRHLITTLGTTVWHIDEYSHTILDASSVGQFHAGDSYIVRWTYRITITGNQLSGQPSKHVAVGRDRCAYFIWQGQTASPNEQGTAALLTVELDHEKGPQIQVIQGFESPAFLNLFSGGMVVHFGNRMDQEREDRYRLYICQGTLEAEVSLVEVPCVMQSLRSRCSFLLLDRDTDKLYLWHGNAALPHIKENALKAANNLKISCPEEAGLNADSDVEIVEINEGDEPEEFYDAIGKNDSETRVYLQLENSKVIEHTPRLFQLSSVSGEFKPTELLCAHRADLTTPYPFLQVELYQVNQPALFMLDNGDEIWLWQGWWPDSGSDDQTGSGAVRWQSERRAAMRTAIKYWQTNHSESTELPISLVWAGLEPLEFTNLFPMWEIRDDVAELNMQDGHNKGEVLSIQMELEKLTQSTYPPAELLQRPLPQGVDPTRLELYLSADDFQELFGMANEDFQVLPAWKQIKLKKEIGLF